jgi:hypothetical protein
MCSQKHCELVGCIQWYWRQLQFGCSDSSVIASSCLKMLTQHAHNDDYTIDDGHKLGRPSPLSTE